MKREARNYQTECREAVKAAFARGLKGVAVELSTGLGKGFIIADIVRMVREKGGRVLVLVNRDNLVNQLSASIAEQGIIPVIERGMDNASPMSDCVVGSIQTLQKNRLLKWNRNHFRLVLTDEAHGAAAKTFRNVLDYFESAYHIFLSATIERHDKKGLWDGVTEIVYSMPLQKGIEEGWLVPFQFEELPVPITIDDKLATKKMFTEEDESAVFSAGNYLPRLFAEAATRVVGRKALMFWPNCDASKEATKHFQEQGLDAKHVDGYESKSEIATILDWFKEPGPKVLSNADLLSVGYDCPPIDCVGIMRLSRSIPMLKQRLGRGTRPLCDVDSCSNAEERRSLIAASPKPSVLVLDLMLQLGEVQNKFADATQLITEDSEEKKFLREEISKAGRPLNMEELKDKLRVKKETDREKQLAKLAEDAANAAERKRNRSSFYVGDILRNYNPAHKPASDKFVRFVERLTGLELKDGPYSAFQIYRIKERFEKARERELV